MLVLVVALPAAAAGATADAGAPDGGAAASGLGSARIAELYAAVSALEALSHGELDPGVDPGRLFDADLSDAAEVALEVARLRAVLSSPPEGGALAAEPEHAGAPPAIAPALRDARRARDRARLAFLELPGPRRTELLEGHERRRKERSAARPPLAEAERRVQDARRAEQQARAAALRARSEAARLMSEEMARLLAVSADQVEFAAGLEQRRARISELREVTLGWQRRSRELREELAPAQAIDAAYDELRRDQELSRAQLTAELEPLASGTSAVPRPGPDRLAGMPAEIDTAEVRELWRRVTEEAERLERAEREAREATASVLFEQTVALNRERLALLPRLSEENREAVTGLTLAGAAQAGSELEQLALILRYNRQQSLDWIRKHLAPDGQWGPLLLQALVLLLEWLLCSAAFAWWRRQSKRYFDVWFAALRKRDRQLRLSEPSRIERGLVFLTQVHGPLEWLAFCAGLWWLLPREAQALLELQLVAVVFAWVLAGALVVSTVNALADRSRRAPHNQQDASLRLRSLRLVGRVVIVFGLVLSISSRLVGQGTIYEWVQSFAWLAAAPLFLLLIRWWRPSVFERIARQRKHTPFERWLLANRSGWKSFVAAMSGAVFLFGRGLLRAFLRWLGTFDLTRRGLAYLFQRELEKLGSERTSMVGLLERLPADTYEQLGPSVPSGRHVATDTDEALGPATTRLAQGGCLMAVVGERGLGKTTVLGQLEARLPESLHIALATGTLEELAAALGAALGLGRGASLAEAARAIDTAGGPRAVFIDDAQRLVQPRQGGLDGFDELLGCARAHSRRASWVFSFRDAIWQFIEQSRGAYPCFDQVLQVQRWREPQIAELLRTRCRQAGIDPSFERLLERLPPNADSIDREEALAERANGYHRLIWDYAHGNPGVALDVWRRALGVDAAGKVWVQLFPVLNTGDLERLPDTAMFVLRAVLQMAPVQSSDIERATLLSRAHVADVLRYSISRGFLECSDQGYQISWTWLRPLMRLLSRKHLLVST